MASLPGVAMPIVLGVLRSKLRDPSVLDCRCWVFLSKKSASEAFINVWEVSQIMAWEPYHGAQGRIWRGAADTPSQTANPTYSSCKMRLVQGRPIRSFATIQRDVPVRSACNPKDTYLLSRCSLTSLRSLPHSQAACGIRRRTKVVLYSCHHRKAPFCDRKRNKKLWKTERKTNQYLNLPFF